MITHCCAVKKKYKIKYSESILEFLTQLLCLVYVHRAEKKQLLHGLERSTSCWAGKVVKPQAALSVASNGCTQPFAVFAKLESNTIRISSSQNKNYYVKFAFSKLKIINSVLTRGIPEITALSTFSSLSFSCCFTPSDHTAHQWWTQQPPI